LALAIFKSSKRCFAGFQKIIILGNISSRLKSQQARLWTVFKALSAALRNLLTSKSQGFELTGFQKL
jgi:hypothetical protein